MKTRCVRLSTAAVILASFVSCATVVRSGGKRGILQGMLYDFENTPVSGYIFSIDGRQKTATDINGRFAFNDVAYGTHQVSGEGKKHISYRDSYEFSDRGQILYVRLPSNDWLYRWVDRQLEKGNLAEAEKSLALFSAEEKITKKHSLYTAIFNFRSSGESKNPEYLEEAKRLRREW